MTARPHIENTLSRYAWTMDMDELDGIGACFTADARVDFPEGVGLKVGRAAIVEELRRRRAAYHTRGVWPWHVITNVFVMSETESEAVVRSFFTALRTDADGAPLVNSIGVYADTFVDDGDAWRINERRVLSAKAIASANPIPD